MKLSVKATILIKIYSNMLAMGCFELYVNLVIQTELVLAPNNTLLRKNRLKDQVFKFCLPL